VTLGEQLRYARQAMLAQAGELLTRRRAHRSALARGAAPPDSRYARESLETARASLERPILQHSLRCWLWADLFAQIDSVKYDPEALYVACLLHDVGLGERFAPPPQATCFAVHGSEVARRELLGWGAPAPLADRAAEAIAHHMDVHVPVADGAEAHLLHAAAHLDVAGTRGGELSGSQRLEVLRRHPRDGFRPAFAACMRREARLRPRSRAAVSWRLGMRVPMALNPLERDMRLGGALLPQAAGARVTLERGLSAIACDGASECPPVLLLHGMMGGAWQFDGFQRALRAAGYSSLALDYRGHHESAGRLGGVREYVDDAAVACAALGEPPIVVGQSMGGLVAQLLAARMPVRAAVLVCSLPPRGIRWRGVRDQRFALRHASAVLTGRALTPDRAELEDLILNGFADESARDLYFVRQVPESSRAGVEIAYGLLDVPRLDCPVLSVTAGADRLVFPSVGAALAERHGGELLHFEDRGHYALVGEPGWEAVAARIIGWIDER
jgi:pimeloyl-ACP methyl ester carboxylesterase